MAINRELFSNLAANRRGPIQAPSVAGESGTTKAVKKIGMDILDEKVLTPTADKAATAITEKMAGTGIGNMLGMAAPTAAPAVAAEVAAPIVAGATQAAAPVVAGATAGGTAAASAPLAAMGPVGWAALAALTLGPMLFG